MRDVQRIGAWNWCSNEKWAALHSRNYLAHALARIHAEVNTDALGLDTPRAGIRAFLARPQFVPVALMMLAMMPIALFIVGGFISRKREGPRQALSAFRLPGDRPARRLFSRLYRPHRSSCTDANVRNRVRRGSRADL